MAKVLKVMYKGEEIKLQQGSNVGNLHCQEIYNLNEEVKGYALDYYYPMYSDTERVGIIDLVQPENSWLSTKDVKVTIEEEKVTLEKAENKQGVILNYTPHTVNIIDAEGNKIQDFPSQGEARCKQETTSVGTIGNVPITSTTFGEVTGLPEEKEGTYYIVSRLIRQALPGRRDLLVPNDMVRDEQGRIVGCKSLANN